MIICVDLGNTTTAFGILDGTLVKAFWRIITTERTSDEYANILSTLITRNGVDISLIDRAGVCSVVPSETHRLVGAISSVLDVDARIIDGCNDSGITVATDNPSEVGGDRIANAAAAYYGYGGPAIVIDVGTATTFDYVSEKGEYLGGAIAPGLMSGATDLWRRTRMLPAVEVKRPARVIGTSTVTCMQSGLYYGSIAQIEGIIRRMWSEIGAECRVILTGGQAETIRRDLGVSVEYDLHLTLKGIAYAADAGLRPDKKAG
jgi:type III pantothenate kinase